MGRRIRIELTSRNDFWRNAFFVEWNHQYPERSIEDTASGRMVSDDLLVPAEWLQDLQRVAGQCFSAVREAPADPGRRRIFRNLFSSGQG